MPGKNCVICGKIFYRTNSKFYNDRSWQMAKYCGQECRARAWVIKRDQMLENGIAPSAFYKVRFEVFKRDSFKCFYCGRSSIEDGITLV